MNKRAYVKQSLDICSRGEARVAQMIYDFLINKGLEETAASIRKEVSDSELSLTHEPIRRDRISKEVVDKISSSFDERDHVAFFQWWGRVPDKIKLLHDYKELTIHLFTHFSTIKPKSSLGGTYVIRDGGFREMGDIAEVKDFESDSLEEDEPSAMTLFKEFLSQKGSEYTHPEFLPYFALPFIENPRTHPTFTRVFENEWVELLEDKLTHFLVEYSCGDAVVPELTKMCGTYYSDSKNENRQMKEVKRKLHRLKKDHHQLVQVASELALALEKSLEGDGVHLDSVLKNCASIFPDLFPKTLIRMSNQSLTNELNVEKIKNDLINGSIKTQLLLLQALRWLMTKSRGDERVSVLGWIIDEDILWSRNGSLCTLLSTSVPHPLLQSVTRLLNAVVSFESGREYASSGPFIDVLVEATRVELDPITELMVIASLQKLSLRRKICSVMIEDVFPWVLMLLDTRSMSKYALEYSTSLLMNLSRCLDINHWEQYQDFPRILTKRLVHVHKPAFEFICGTLCCALRNDAINNLFKNENLAIKLEETHRSLGEDPVAEKQIQTLIRLHERVIDPNSFEVSGESELKLEDPEMLDPEIDENDTVRGTPSGYELLENHYSIG